MSFAEFGFGETTFASNNVIGGITQVSADFGIPFNILGDIRRDYIIRHTVSNGVEQEFILDYELQGAVFVDFSIPFALIGRTERSFIISNSIIKPEPTIVVITLTKNVIIKNSIIEGLSRDFIINNEITDDVFQDFIVTWDIIPRVDSIITNNKICSSRPSRTLKIKG